MSQFLKKRTIEEMIASIYAYLPGGDLFAAARIKDKNQYNMLKGIGFTLLDVENFISVFNSEFIPLNTTAFIEEWESALGIPDECFPGSAEPNLSTRRLHILVKLASLGVQTVDDFVNLATIMGFSDTEVIPGVDFGVTPILEARFTIVVLFKAPVENIFPLNFPIPFGTDQFAILTCLFSKLKPANVNIVFELNSGPIPLLSMPLINDVDIDKGTGVSTFTRATEASFVDIDDGRLKFKAIDAPRFENNSYLSESDASNLTSFPEDLSNAAYTKTKATILINSKASPAGKMASDKLIEDNTNNIHSVGQAVSVTSGVTYTFNCFCVKGERDRISLTTGTSFAANEVIFDLTNGVIVSEVGATAEILENSQGGYRLSITATATATASSNFDIRLNDGVSTTYLGDGTSGAYVWGINFITKGHPTSYIRGASRSYDGLTIPTSGNLPSAELPHSISFTAKSLGSGNFQYLYSDAINRRYARIESDGITMRVRNGNINVYTLNDPLTTTSKIVITFDGTTEEVFQNNVSLGSNVKTIASTNPAVLTIGGLGGTGSSRFDGTMRYFKIFDKVLDQEEIEGLPT